MTTLLLFPLLTVALWHAGAVAKLTYPITRRFPRPLQEFMACAACSGFWFGALVNGMGALLDLSFLGLPCRSWYAYPVVALASATWTPLGAWVHTRALLALDAILDPPPGPER